MRLLDVTVRTGNTQFKPVIYRPACFKGGYRGKRVKNSSPTFPLVKCPRCGFPIDYGCKCMEYDD